MTSTSDNRIEHGGRIAGERYRMNQPELEQLEHAENATYALDVSLSGDTVWVTAHDGSCVGRFSKRFGIDVHRTVTEQLDGAQQCLFCTHGLAGENEWQAFRDAMYRHYSIDVPPETIRFQ